MPPKVTQAPSGFLGAVKSKAKEATTYGMDFSDPPPGITKAEGRAEVIECSIGEYKNGDLTGKKFLRFAANIKTPKSVMVTHKIWEPAKGNVPGKIKVVGVKDTPAAGLQTSRMYPLCADKNKTQEENIGYALNEMRRTMGDDGYTEPLAAAKDEAQAWAMLEKLAAGVKAEAPIIIFSTRAGNPTEEFPEQRTWQEWHGRDTEFVDPGDDPSSGVTVDGQTMIDANAGQDTGNADGLGTESNDDQQGEATAAGDEPDLDALAALADPPSSDSDAQAQLDALADSLGLTEEAAAASSYAAVVELIRTAQGGDAEPAEEPFVPVLKGSYGYEKDVLKDAKNPKKGMTKKKIEVTVLSIDKAKETVTLQDNATKKPIMDATGKKAVVVPWGELIVS